MSSSFIVLENPADRANPGRESVKLVRDGWSWLAFLFPLIWVLVHRLWFAGLIMIVVFGALAAGSLNPANIPFVYAAYLLLCAWTALQGGVWRVSALERAGYRQVGTVLAANLADAQLRWALHGRKEQENNAATKPQSSNLIGRPARRASQTSDLVFAPEIGNR